MEVTNPALQTKVGFFPRLVLSVLLVVILEGAVRKWIYAGSTVPLLLLRDTMVVLGLLYAARKGAFRRNDLTQGLVLLWSLLVIVWSGFQVIAELQSGFVALLGFRSWLLYFWFAFACSRMLTKADLEFLARSMAYLLLLMAPLAITQHMLPIGHVLNKQTSEGLIFTVSRDIVRTTGTFSFTLGYTQFVGFASAAALSLLAGETLGVRSRVLRFSILAACLSATVVSGSRACIVTGMMLASGAYATLLLRRSNKGKRQIAGLVLGLISFLLVPILFSRAIEATEERFEGAAKVESASERLKQTLISNETIWNNLTILGNGIGLGANAAGAFVQGGSKEGSFLLGETDSDRILLGGGILGVIFLFAKIFCCFAGSWLALLRLRQTGDALPWMLWLFASSELLFAQITGQLSSHAFGWLSVGFAWAAIQARPKTAATFRASFLPRTLMTAAAMTSPYARTR